MEGVADLPSWLRQDFGDSSEEEKLVLADHGTEEEAVRPWAAGGAGYC